MTFIAVGAGAFVLGYLYGRTDRIRAERKRPIIVLFPRSAKPYVDRPN